MMSTPKTLLATAILFGWLLGQAAAQQSGAPTDAGAAAPTQTQPVGGVEWRLNAAEWRLDEYLRSAQYYREPYRQQFHFSPPLNWMNDPNGLVYHNGAYHLFYQHNPLGNTWGHMSWGHAVSRDLVEWEHWPIALHEEYGVMIFSGSAVFDAENTSGFGTADDPPLVAIYTGHGQGRQTQDLAYSVDGGRCWTKYRGNPVLDLGMQDFRDPKVFWHVPTNRWIMVVSLAVDKIIHFYASTDLKEWTYLSEFGPAGVADKPNWECPDLFPLPIEGEPGEMRWVLEADMGSGAIAGGSGGEYFVGTFDGTTFVPEPGGSQWVDYGRDFYAPISWNNLPSSDGRRLWIGWMNNWHTAEIPTSVWRSCMSVPRLLRLRRVDGRLRMVQNPLAELKTLRGRRQRMVDVTIEGDAKVPVMAEGGQQVEIVAEFEPGDAKQFGLIVRGGEQERTIVGYDPGAEQLYVDRTKSGNVVFHPDFAGKHPAPLPLRDGRIKLHILVDSSSVEVFGNDGEVVITDRVFPDPRSGRVELFADGGSARLVSLELWPLRSIWHDGSAAAEPVATPPDASTLESEPVGATP